MPGQPKLKASLEHSQPSQMHYHCCCKILLLTIQQSSGPWRDCLFQALSDAAGL